MPVEKQKPIKRLAKGRSSFQYASVWLYSDHVLSCRNHKYTEQYKRFYFKTIQAILIQPTQYRMILNSICLVLCAFLLYLGFLVLPEAQITFVVLAGVPALITVINTLLGPTCHTFIQTAVQREKVLALDRIRKAEKFLVTVKPLIEAAQGNFTTEALNEEYEQMLSVSEAQAKPTASITEKPLAPYGVTQTHTLFFALIFLDFLIMGCDFFWNNWPLSILLMIHGSLMMIFGIMALIKQARIRVKDALVQLTWVTAGFLVIQYIAAYFIYMGTIIALSAGTEMTSQFELYRAMMNVNPDDNMILYYYYIIVIAVSFIIGTTGLMLCATPKEEKL